MVMTQDTLDKTRSEFSRVFSRSAHHFSLPLLVRIHNPLTQVRGGLAFSFVSPLFLFLIFPQKKTCRYISLFISHRIFRSPKNEQSFRFA